MILGYLLLGWIGGLCAAMVHLTLFHGTWGEAVGLFYAVALALIGVTAVGSTLRATRCERLRHARELSAPVEALASVRAGLRPSIKGVR